MDQITELYKARGDALEAMLDNLERDLSQMLASLAEVKQALSDMDNRYGLTQGEGSQKELCDTLRRNFPDWADKSDEELLAQFGNQK